MKIRLIVMAGLVLAGAVSSYGAVIAAWDLSSGRGGAVPAGWTTWTVADITNQTANTVGGLTLSISSATAPTVGQTQIDAAGVWHNVAAPLVTLGTDAPSQSVYEDYLTGMTTAKATTLTLSGLTAGQQYQVQFLSVFQVFSPAQLQTVVQDGVTVASIDSTGVGALTDNRLVYSGYYTFTATALDTDVAFLINGSTTGNAGKNGIAAVMVIPEPATMGLVGATGFMLLWLRRRFMV